MPHTEVLKFFELYFPFYAGDKIKVWYPNGKNSIRVRQQNDQDLVFTFNSHTNWKFETIKSFIDYTMKGINKK